MGKASIAKLLIIFLGLFSLTMTAPLCMALILGEKEMIPAFAIPLGITLAVSAPVFLFSRKKQPGITSADGIFLVASAWICGSLLGAVPFRLSGYVPRFSLAVFESVSGFTTTGTSIIADLEILPRSFHLWRGMSHWLGGIGIVVLAVALVPVLGVGGFQLLKAETTGPVKEKITPKVAGTAKILWFIYCGLTLILIALYVAGGMSIFDAVFHAFSTMGSGGFSTRNESIAAFHSPYIEWVTILFMLIAGFNFTLVYRLLQRRFREVAANSEARAYGILIAAAGLAAAFALFPQTGSVEKSLRLAFFHAASIISSTGYAISNHNNWAPLAQMAVFLLLFSGGCSGSTAGGIKIIRYVILGKQMKNEIRRALFPSGLFSIQLDNKPGRKDVIYSAAGFVCLYYFILLAGTALGTAAGMNLFDAVNAAAITTGNIGLGFGSLVSGGIFTEIPAWAVWGYSLLMITGRLELFTVLLLFVPEYWKR